MISDLNVLLNVCIYSYQQLITLTCNLGNLYLECCIIDAEISVVRVEFFKLLHQSFIRCSQLILLLLQSHCQVCNLTVLETNTVHMYSEYWFLLYTKKGWQGETTNLFNKSTWATSLSFSSVISSFRCLLESLSEWALASWASCVPNKPKKVQTRASATSETKLMIQFDLIPFPSAAHSISQWLLQIAPLSVSALGWLSSEILCPALLSRTEMWWTPSDHQSPSSARLWFSPEPGKTVSPPVYSINLCV